MKNKKNKCPVCETGMLKPAKIKHSIFGVDLGTYPREKCTNCGETFTDSKVMEKMEVVAKQKGVWGMGKRTKIARAGNSLAVRIPKEIADYLHLKEGKEAYIHPEANKLVIEPSE